MLVNASKLESNKKNAFEKTAAILQRALDIVEKEIQNRLNKNNILSYMKAMFQFEIGKLNYEKVINKSGESKSKSQPTHYFQEKVNTMRPGVYKVVSQTCKVSNILKFLK